MNKMLIRKLTLILLLGMIVFLMPTVTIFAQSSSSKSTKANIAVWDFSLQGIGENEGRAVTNKLRSELVNTGLFRIMSRDQVKKLLGEIALGQTLGDPKEAIKAGKLKGVEFVVTGTLVSLMGAVQITAEMIDGETGEIIRSITPRPYRGGFLDFMDNDLPFIAKQLAGIAEEIAPPEYMEEKSKWHRNWGYGWLAAAVIFQYMAYDLSTQAKADAEQSRKDLDPKLYDEAKEKKTRAMSYQLLAIVSGTVSGSNFILYRESTSFSHNESFNKYATTRYYRINLSVQPKGARVGYIYQW